MNYLENRMIRDLTKRELINLIKGTELESCSNFNDLEFKGMFDYSDAYSKFEWRFHKLNNMTEFELNNFYDRVKKANGRK